MSENEIEAKSYVVPKNKKQLIEYINEVGIEDIFCTTILQDGPHFGVEILTKDKKCFSITQDVNVTFGEMVVEDFSTGNGYSVLSLGKHFNPKKYSYNLDSPWVIESEFTEED